MNTKSIILLKTTLRLLYNKQFSCILILKTQLYRYTPQIMLFTYLPVNLLIVHNCGKNVECVESIHTYNV